MSDVLGFADALWRGEEHHPFGASGTAEVRPDTLFVGSFGNAIALRGGESLIVVDTGSPLTAGVIKDEIGRWSDVPVETIVYTHGHIDHVMGADVIGSDATTVVAHENVAARFERYEMTPGYNAAINRRQFGIDDLEWPTSYRYPDRTYRDELELTIDAETFVLRHGKGETDDATWVWAPDRDLICCGDFFIWACPNAGNPQKAQRYPREWATALRAMEALDVSMLLPGHGPPVIGRDRVAAVLGDGAVLLESIVSQTLDLMNEGASLEEVVARVDIPAALLAKPYLRPIYDEPEFIVRNVWRLYGGWFDGDPAHLKPPPRGDVATEIALLCGGAREIAARAQLVVENDARLACELVEIALASDAADQEVRRVSADVYARRAEIESSTMSKGIFTWAARRTEKQ